MLLGRPLERAVVNGCPRRADPLRLTGLDMMKVRIKSAAIGRRQKFTASRPASASTYPCAHSLSCPVTAVIVARTRIPLEYISTHLHHPLAGDLMHLPHDGEEDRTRPLDSSGRSSSSSSSRYRSLSVLERLPACLHVPLTYLSCIPDALHRCFADLIELGAGDSWTPRSARRAMASHLPCTPSSSTPAGVLG